MTLNVTFSGDMVATDACYHKPCLIALYNKLRNFLQSQTTIERENEMCEGIALAQLIDYIRGSFSSESTIPVFKLANLKTLYGQLLSSYGASEIYINNIHSSRLKQKILRHAPELEDYKKGRDVLLKGSWLGNISGLPAQ